MKTPGFGSRELDRLEHACDADRRRVLRPQRAERLGRQSRRLPAPNRRSPAGPSPAVPCGRHTLRPDRRCSAGSGPLPTFQLSSVTMVCEVPSANSATSCRMTRGSPMVRCSRRLMWPHRRKRQRIEPAVAEHHPQRVAAPLQLVGHVVGGIEHALRIGGPARVEHLVADPLAVQAQLVVAQPADIDPGAAELLLDRKLLPEQRRRVVLEHLLLCERRRAAGA